MTKEISVILGGRSLNADVLPFRTRSYPGGASSSMATHVTAPFMLAGRIRNRDQRLEADESLHLEAPAYQSDGPEHD